MTFSSLSPWLAVPLGVFALACEPGGVGDPCIPEDEYYRDFGGYGEEEANVETRSFQCTTRVCMVNHFRGRVSCPYGQAEGQVLCAIPGTTGTDAIDQIVVPVPAQLENRRSENTVYCSCRCDGPDENARYCECPSGFTCAELVPELDLGRGGGQLAGSYCIKEDTEFNAQAPRIPCNREAETCGPCQPGEVNCASPQ